MLTENYIICFWEIPVMHFMDYWLWIADTSYSNDVTPTCNEYGNCINLAEISWNCNVCKHFKGRFESNNESGKIIKIGIVFEYLLKIKKIKLLLGM